jgi:alpha-amylase/alpha-mannosidase (GH57 family)
MPAAPATPFVCLHGHFYQPPRENPWLETVEIQDSAAPYHDWNARVLAECYAPNTAARLLDPDGSIAALRNNYNHISFNFGPTLLSWMEHQAPNVYAQIVLADQDSQRRLGRGNALAQVYGHCIMPLASRRDQQTQVRWGIADFVQRFGRQPDGMWLPETAVDRATLTVLAEHGMRFTILAPSQAARVRLNAGAWTDVHDRIDSTRPYRCVLGPKLAITVFFYDADISHAIAFGGLLNDGHELARRLTRAAERPTDAPLLHIATDGESYGHHHRFGEMALAAAIETLQDERRVRLTNYAAYLDAVPVRDEVDIRENTSWSCAHGIERWRSDCRCCTGTHAGWQQAWRAPLRQSLDWLKHQLDRVFERHGSRLLRDPWAARDDYIAVLLRRDASQRDAFLERHASGHPPSRERTRIWKLLEMQRYGLLSFTSCGWFFDEPSGIETVQILTYAARALQLAAELDTQLEPGFLHRLQPLQSNLPRYADGRQLYRQLVRPQITNNDRVVAHYAMHSLFTAQPETQHYAYRFTSIDRTLEHAGSASLIVGRTELHSDATEERAAYDYAALHLGGHDIHCAVARSTLAAGDSQRKSALLATFFGEPLSELVRSIDREFGGNFYTLSDVFVAERRAIIDHVTAQVIAGCTADYERMVTHNRRLLEFLARAQVPVPQELRVAASFVLQRRMQEAVQRFAAGAGSAEAALAVRADAQRWDVAAMTGAARQSLETALVRTLGDLSSSAAATGVGRAHAVLDLAHALDATLNLWEAQNQYYVFIATGGARACSASELGELRRLGERLSFHLREWDSWARAA